MKQVTQNYKTGKINLEDVEWPALKPGGVLIRTRYSVISSGTEGMKVREGKLSYVGKARARPDQLKKVLDAVRQQGVVAAYNKVMNKLDALTPLGYSLSGEVVAVGEGAEEFRVGQRVACAGAGYANHAEINFVPKNLVVPVPDSVSMKHAAFATVGAIALQGLRQAQMQLGETACVIGLGLLGQLLVQILRAAGMQVIGVDLIEGRCRLAEQLGAKAATTPKDAALDSVVARLTGGHGADCVFIAAGGAGNAATALAVRVARDRARIVDIGKTRLDLPWNDCYMKELDVRFSRSYGPGRYDPTYEERGIDYPIGYVRWTERRNLCAFLELLCDGKVAIEPIISGTYSFVDAEGVYQRLAQPGNDVLGIVLDYGESEEPLAAPLPGRLISSVRPARSADRLRLGLIGAGNYASSMLLPHLVRHRSVDLIGVATATSLSAQNAKRKFGFELATTDYEELLTRDDIDAVIIATRHASHARLVAEALRRGKTVYVEKPLAINLSDLELVRRAIVESGNDRLMVGFNRRFSPMVRAIGERFGAVPAPLVGHYRVHAGRMERSSWYLDPAEGSRFVGEAGHFFDVLSYVLDSRPVAVSATALRPSPTNSDDLENIAAVVRYEDGSLGNLLYLTQGGGKLPKEQLEIHGAGMTMQLQNFESLWFFDQTEQERTRAMRVDKGQQSELNAFVESAISGAAMPIPVDSLFDTTLTTLAAMESVRTGKEVALTGYWLRSSSAPE
jgi:predicted dehydrogenase/threonine dehydrogenase-like Zn-dependent dehydrogenase